MTLVAKHSRYSNASSNALSYWLFCRLARITNSGPRDIILGLLRCLRARRILTPPFRFLLHCACALAAYCPVTVCFRHTPSILLKLRFVPFLPRFFSCPRHSPSPVPVPNYWVSSLPYRSLHLSLISLLLKDTYSIMASATATATMAAAGFNKHSSSHAASSLQTPGSGTFPSELRSPMVASPSLLKKDDALKTPITPPSAYLDFLKNMSPALMSPLPTGTSTHFKFPAEKTSNRISEVGVDKPIHSPAASQPALSRNTSFESASSSSTSSTESVVSHSSANTTSRSKPQSPRITIPPSSFAMPAPRSSRTPRRLHIPQSPFTPALSSAHSMPSPYSGTPLSAAPWSATYSPRDADPEANGKPGKVSVRQVVTRTVTYCRTPLEPAPRGKRRKLDAPAAGSSLLDSYLEEREEARKAEEATEDKITKAEPEVKREASEEPIKSPTSVSSAPSPAKDT